ncbi:MAG TPA: hypothetical protein VL907_06855 [Pyrinomonadaceae bacterium]|jgi:hypothetical protein|nr:hypothetical protein [Pyrinomonadaceae bacterium]
MSVMLVRAFGVLGVILGAAYLCEGVLLIRWVVRVGGRLSPSALLPKLSFITWDVLFGLCLIVAAVGLMLWKQWGRMMWLALLPALLLVHLAIITKGGLFGYVNESYLIWTGMVAFVTALSWWYLNKTQIRARFARSKQDAPDPKEA